MSGLPQPGVTGISSMGDTVPPHLALAPELAAIPAEFLDGRVHRISAGRACRLRGLIHEVPEPPLGRRPEDRDRDGG